MLHRVVANGVVCYISPLLQQAGIPHGFSTRIGGVSPKPFNSLNLGNCREGAPHDDPDLIQENYRRFLLAVDCHSKHVLRVHQVHGRNVVHIRSNSPPHEPIEADAILTDDPHSAASIRTADCVPILLAAADGRLVAAVHAGWKGIIAAVVPATVKAMAGRAADGITAAIGPCIGGDAFEVGPEVIEQFRRAFGPAAPVRPDGGSGRAHVDLRRCVELQLIAAGIPSNRIDSTDRCTFRDRDEFFSHRRDRGITGRMAAIISPRA